MTNQEAIKELSEWLDGCCGGEEIEPTRQALRLAISALQEKDSPKPTAESAQNVQNEDLISRKAAIDYCYALINAENPSDEWNYSQERINQTEVILHHLEFMPSAQSEPQWIPVSERLPKVGHSVLFSRRSMDTREGCLQADGKWWQYRWNEILNADQVTAWMPLLEPYRAERRTDERSD